MTTAVPVSIPRWQWSTIATDLSGLFRRVPVSQSDQARRLEETHLVCLQSSHHAFLSGDTLELRWRKEIGPEGFELWDTILKTGLPFGRNDLARLWAAWGIPSAPPQHGYRTIASFLHEAIAPVSAVVPVAIIRERHDRVVQGIACSIETVEAGPDTRLQTFSIEHEDPSLMEQLLADLGLDARDNINFLQGLKEALGLPAATARNQTWPRKSNASSS